MSIIMGVGDGVFCTLNIRFSIVFCCYLLQEIKKVMEPCHVTGMFQTSMLSAAMATSQEWELGERHS
jgi:hypothetical protein